MPKELPTVRTPRTYRDRLLRGGTAADPAPFQPRPLLPWEFTFAEWLSFLPKRPSVAQQQAKVKELSGEDFTVSQVRNLKALKEFKEYYGNMQASLLRRARAKIERDFDVYVDAHKDGLTKAVEADDHRAIPNYTVPIIDRIYPKKDTAIHATAITVNLSTKQHELLDAEDAEVEVQEIEAEEL